MKEEKVEDSVSVYGGGVGKGERFIYRKKREMLSGRGN